MTVDNFKSEKKYFLNQYEIWQEANVMIVVLVLCDCSEELIEH